MTTATDTKHLLDALGTLNLTRADASRIIEVLRERVKDEPLDLTDSAWRCDVCGSTNVQCTAWVSLNAPDTNGYQGELDDDTYCNDCGSHETAHVRQPEDAPLFCKCLAETEEGELPEASWTSAVGKKRICPVCHAVYTTTKPGAK